MSRAFLKIDSFLKFITTFWSFSRAKTLMDECLICLELIENNYAIVDNEHERGIYHIQCLEKWLKDSCRGVLSREKPISYIVFNNGVRQEIFIKNVVPISNDKIEN